MTHTYVKMLLSAEAYDEIAANMRVAEYDHAFGDEGEIDMHGIAVTRGKVKYGVAVSKAISQRQGVRPDNSHPRIQIDAQGLDKCKASVEVKLP